MRPLAFLSAIGLVGCGFAELPDEIHAQVISPDRQLVARAWCLDGCDIPHKRRLTIGSAAEQAGERMPAADEVLVFYLTEAEAIDVELRWPTNRRLEIYGKCLLGNDLAPLPDSVHGGIAVRLVRQPTERPCA